MKQPKEVKRNQSARRDGRRPGFNAQEAMLLERLGHEAEGAVSRNDDARVFVTLGEALTLLAGRAARRKARPAKRRVAADFEALSGFESNQACHEYVTSCINLEKYSEGLAVIEGLLKTQALELSVIVTDAAELLAHLGRSEEAERLMLTELDRNPNEIKNYLCLGDIYYHWQEQEEARDYAQAEMWFYRAFDRGLARGGSEEAKELIDHLGDVCLDRLRSEAELALLDLLQKLDMGDWRTIADLRDSVWREGSSSRLLRHVYRVLSPAGTDETVSADRLRALFSFYEHTPQESLGGYSAFERVELIPPGHHEARIMHDLAEAYAKSTGDRSVNIEVFLTDDFFRFQKSFLDGIDQMTGKRRAVLLSDERVELRHRHEEGNQPWLGFLRYRKQ